MSTETYFELPDTNHIPSSDTTYLGPLASDYNMFVILIINRTIDKTQTDPIINKIIAYCSTYNLITEQTDAYHINISGEAQNFTNAFGVQMNSYQCGDDIYYGSSVKAKAPIDWQNELEHIMGFCSKRICRRNALLLQPSSLDPHIPPPPPYNPLQLATLYDFPTNLDGTGQLIGIVEFNINNGSGYKNGFVSSDITTYLTNLGIVPTPTINVVFVNGGVNIPNTPPQPEDYEVTLDIEIVAALAPSSTINVYFAPDSNANYYAIVQKAINDGCNLITTSWGNTETAWGATDANSFNTLLGTAATNNITFLAAAGDFGSSDGGSGLNVDFPGSSVYSLCCGGTTLQTTNGTTISSEVVWNNG